VPTARFYGLAARARRSGWASELEPFFENDRPLVVLGTAGEIRGQMTLDAQAGVQQVFFPPIGTQETPSVITTASGRCVALVELHPDLPVVSTPFDLHLTSTAASGCRRFGRRRNP
jgi:hypothetical protein